MKIKKEKIFDLPFFDSDGINKDGIYISEHILEQYASFSTEMEKIPLLVKENGSCKIKYFTIVK